MPNCRNPRLVLRQPKNRLMNFDRPATGSRQKSPRNQILWRLRPQLARILFRVRCTDFRVSGLARPGPFDVTRVFVEFRIS